MWRWGKLVVTQVLYWGQNLTHLPYWREPHWREHFYSFLWCWKKVTLQRRLLYLKVKIILHALEVLFFVVASSSETLISNSVMFAFPAPFSSRFVMVKSNAIIVACKSLVKNPWLHKKTQVYFFLQKSPGSENGHSWNFLLGVGGPCWTKEQCAAICLLMFWKCWSSSSLSQEKISGLLGFLFSWKKMFCATLLNGIQVGYGCFK